jgi:hypothetical protein
MFIFINLKANICLMHTFVTLFITYEPIKEIFEDNDSFLSFKAIIFSKGRREVNLDSNIRKKCLNLNYLCYDK